MIRKCICLVGITSPVALGRRHIRPHIEAGKLEGLAALRDAVELPSLKPCGLKHLHCELSSPGQDRHWRIEPDRRRQPGD